MNLDIIVLFWQKSVKIQYYDDRLDLHYNLIAIVDRNNLTVLDFTEKIIKLNPFKEKWLSFGWNVLEVDGHNMKEVHKKINYFKKLRNGKPSILIANTLKGKGISFMENQIKWHHGVPSKELLKKMRSDLS